MPKAMRLISANPPGAYASVIKYQGNPVIPLKRKPAPTAVDINMKVEPKEILIARIISP